MITWTDYFLGIVDAVAARSKDRSTQVGAVVVGPDNEVRATGYNGFPRGVDDDKDERHERPAKYEWTEHAERNAIYSAARVGVPLLGCRMYLRWFPCVDCARAIVQSGIKQLVCSAPDTTGRWAGSFATAYELLIEAGVEVEEIE